MLSFILISRLLAALLVGVTALSVIESARWWIRVWDFPRPQIMVGLLVAGGIDLWVDDQAGGWVAAVCAVAAGWQLFRIFPYTLLAKSEMPMPGAEAPPDRCFCVLSLNVLQTNRNYQATLDLIERIEPDILLLMETDQAWVDALQPKLKDYPHVLSAPLDNLYGMVLATRLAMADDQIITDDRGTPAMTAQLSTAAGRKFRLIALHPRPPVPGQNTEQRDGQLAKAARRAAEARLPVLAVGDFNDVAWSHTSRLFRRVGGYLDPRIGRGTYATFPARLVMLGWPLDHLFVTPEFSMQSLQVLGGVGSDHLPITAKLCLPDSDSDSDPGNETPTPPSAEDQDDVEEIIEEAEAARSA